MEDDNTFFEVLVNLREEIRNRIKVLGRYGAVTAKARRQELETLLLRMDSMGNWKVK